MNVSATSAPHSSNEAPAACGGPGGSTPRPPAGQSTAVAPAQASFPASSPGEAASHSPAQASFPASSPGAAAPHSPAQASSPASSPGAAASHSPAQASFPLASTASVPTQRAARYGKQLVSHMGHKITGSWDEEAGSGYLLFDREGPVLGRFDVIASMSDLRLELRTTPERADRLEFIVGIHLARFGARDSLAISWERTDGSEGTTQGPLTPEEVEAHARAKKAAREAAQEAGHAASGHAASGHATE